MRRLTMSALLVLAAGLPPVPAGSQPPRRPAAAPETIAVRLSNFAYSPDPLRLRAGVPVRLQFVNTSGGGHDFVAPAFFAASVFAPGSAPPPEGRLDVPAGATVELTLTPRAAGSYEVACTHFLHSLFGMTGKVVVSTPGG
jgi:plastocyanin